MIVPVSIVAIVMALLAVPMVQTFIAKKASNYLTEISGFKITIQKLRLNLLNQDVLLKGLKIIDRQGNKMVDLEEFSTDFDLFGTIEGKNIYLDKFFLHNGEVNLIVNPKNKELNIQEFIDTIDSLTAPKQKKPRKKGERAAVFLIDEIFLDEITLSYNDPRQDSIKNGFDYGHFKFQHMDGYVQKLLIVADTVSFEAENLQALDKKSGLDIRNLNTKFLHNKRSIQFNNLYVEVNNSILQDSLIFNFESIKDMGNFNEKVRIEARLDSTIIHTHDLALFAPALHKYDDFWHLSGNFSGTVNNFNFTTFNLKFGKHTSLNGDMGIEGLPNVESVLASIQIEPNSVIHTPDLQQYLEDATINEYVQKFGDVTIQGRFDGYPQDFKAKAKLQTALGNADLDAYLIQKENQLPAYQGTIALQDFNTGALTNQSAVGKISMNGNIKGKGFTFETLDTHFDGEVASLEALNYTYQNINLDGNFKNKFFEGKVKSLDNNAQLNLEGTIDFNKPKPELKFNSEVTNLDFKKLGFIPEDLVFRGFIHTQSKGLNIDDFEGDVLLRDADITYRKKSLHMDSLVVSSQKNEYGYSFFDVYSNYFKVNVVGKYNLSQLSSTVSGFFSELFLGIKNQKDAQNNYYAQKKKQKSQNTSLDYEITILDIKPILNLIDTSMYISPDSHFKGVLVGGDSARFTFKSMKPIQTLEFGSYAFYRNTLQFEAYKQGLNENITAELNLYSSTQHLGSVETEKLTLNAIWLDGIIDFRTRIKQKESSNEADIQGHITLDTNKTIVEFDESNVKLLESVWKFEPSRKITLFTNENGKVVFDNFMLSNANQEIVFNGMIAANNPDEKLNIDIDAFQLSTLNTILSGKKIKGILDAHLTIEDVYEEIKINANFKADSVDVNKFYVGNIKGRSNWNNEKQLMELETSIYHKKDYVFFLDGTYQPRQDNLNLSAKIRKAEINMAEPFINEYVSKLEGTVSGDVNITGKLAEPDLNGSVTFNKAKFKVNYLGSVYETSSTINISKNELSFRNFRLFDEEREKGMATLNGRVYHDKFQYFFIELGADFEKFTLLNTKETENALYYGKAVGSGKLMIQGEPADMYIKVDAKTNKGTKLYLPLDGYSEVGDANYFQFVDFQKDKIIDTTKQNTSTSPIKTINLSGLQMDMNLDVTEDAEFQILLDRQTGDIMEGKGRGLMQISIDKRGNFGIWGDYNIIAGSYNFTLKNLMNKKFNIRPNSKIYFEGDVYEAYMDVKASYDANTSFTAFLADNEITPETSRRFPVSVVAHLAGDLLAPKVTFDIDFKDLEKKISNPTLQAAMFKVKSDIQTNELELNRQVGSLVILGQFTSQSSSGGVGAASGRTLGEFLSNQLSGYLSKIDENFKIDLNANEFSSTSTQIGVIVSYTLNDRLKVVSNNRLDSRNQSSNYTGEFIVEYMLSEDGQYKIKAYNRSTFGNNTLTNATTANSTGLTISSTHNFDNFWDLFKRKSKKKKEAQKLPENPLRQAKDTTKTAQ
ncbi:hypothetical protein AD998_16730 [bacterium 336/3]|nr:hypothetical protein AD998_16730 [bacterium 336/3]